MACGRSFPVASQIHTAPQTGSKCDLSPPRVMLSKPVIDTCSPNAVSELDPPRYSFRSVRAIQFFPGVRILVDDHARHQGSWRLWRRSRGTKTCRDEPVPLIPLNIAKCGASLFVGCWGAENKRPGFPALMASLRVSRPRRSKPTPVERCGILDLWRMWHLEGGFRPGGVAGIVLPNHYNPRHPFFSSLSLSHRPTTGTSYREMPAEKQPSARDSDL